MASPGLRPSREQILPRLSGPPATVSPAFLRQIWYFLLFSPSLGEQLPLPGRPAGAGAGGALGCGSHDSPGALEKSCQSSHPASARRDLGLIRRGEMKMRKEWKTGRAASGCAAPLSWRWCGLSRRSPGPGTGCPGLSTHRELSAEIAVPACRTEHLRFAGSPRDASGRDWSEQGEGGGRDRAVFEAVQDCSLLCTHSSLAQRGCSAPGGVFLSPFPLTGWFSYHAPRLCRSLKHDFKEYRLWIFSCWREGFGGWRWTESSCRLGSCHL